jgi:hypothetical protein
VPEFLSGGAMTKGRTTTNSSDPPKTAPPFERALQGGDLAAFEKLVAKGVQREHLTCALSLIPKTAPRPTSASVRGMGERSLLNLPNRIVRFAEELERVNSSPLLEDLIRTADTSEFMMYLRRRKSKYLDRLQEVFPNVPDWESILDYSNEELLRLPNLLRVYATFCLEPIISNLRKSLYKLSGHKYWTIWLLEFVYACTGNYFYSEIARLLNVAFREAGMPKKDEDELDASTLAKLVLNNPKLLESIRAVPLFGKGLTPNEVRALRRKKMWPLY